MKKQLRNYCHRGKVTDPTNACILNWIMKDAIKRKKANDRLGEKSLQQRSVIFNVLEFLQIVNRGTTQ